MSISLSDWTPNVSVSNIHGWQWYIVMGKTFKTRQINHNFFLINYIFIINLVENFIMKFIIYFIIADNL